MKVGALNGDGGYEGKFNAGYIALANHNWANIKTRYSKTTRDRYAANTYKKCEAFIGNHYLFTDYAAAEELPTTDIDAYFYCPVCANYTGDDCKSTPLH